MTSAALRLAWLLGPMLAVGCDATLNFDPPVAQAGEAGEPGSGGTSGTGGGGTGAGGWGGGGGLEPPSWNHAGMSGMSGTNGMSGMAGGPFEPPLDCGARCAQVGERCWNDQCVECVDEMDCYGRSLHCDRSLHRCVPCFENNQCGRGQVCQSGVCVQVCATQSHPDDCVDPEQSCDVESSRCLACRGDDECTASPDRPFCRWDGARCVGCFSDYDCRDRGLLCDPVEAVCVLCRDSGDCTEPALCDMQTHVCVDPRLPGPFPDPGGPPY